MDDRGRRGIAAAGAVALIALGVWVLGPLTIPTDMETAPNDLSTLDPTISRQPVPSPLSSGQPPPIPLKIYSMPVDGSQLAVIDLESGEQAKLSMPPNLMGRVTGGTLTSGGQLILWAPGEAHVVDERGLSEVVVEPSVSTPHLRDMVVVPTPVSELVWLVQSGDDGPTLAELFHLANDSPVSSLELEEDLVPVGATTAGLIFNRREQEVMLLTPEGALNVLAQGRAVTTAADVVVWLLCESDPICRELHVTSVTGGRTRLLAAADESVWIQVGGPFIPFNNLPFATISPDGLKLLMALGQGLDSNAFPATTQLQVLELGTGENRGLASYGSEAAVAMWSRDGRWVVTLEGDHLRLHDTGSVGDTYPVLNPFPDGFVPIAAG